MKSKVYPKADRTSQWWQSLFDRAVFAEIEKILLHSTETISWPGYKGGASAPTLTYNPRTRQWRQHNFLDCSARALVDPDSTPVRENRDDVIQIEIIMYADERIGSSVGGFLVSDLRDEHYQDIADFIKYVRSEWGGPPAIGAEFIAYPESYGNSVVRMTSSEYNGFRGVLGHMNASGNMHGDPGDFDMPKLIGMVVGTQEDEDMPLSDADVARVANAVIFHKVWNLPEGGEPGVVHSSLLNNMGWQTVWTESILKQLAAIAEKVGAPVDVDEAAIAAAVVASIGNTIRDIVTDALANIDGVDENLVAQTIVEKIGSALSGPTQ